MIFVRKNITSTLSTILQLNSNGNKAEVKTSSILMKVMKHNHLKENKTKSINNNHV